MILKKLKNNSKLIAAISFIFALAIIIICFVTTKSINTAHADTTNYKLVLDKDDLSGEGYSYSAATSSLTLNNYKGTTIEFASHDATIILKGTSKLYLDINDNNIYDIFSIKAMGNLKIKGNGLLSIEILNETNNQVKAIDVQNNFIIEEKSNINIKINSLGETSSIKANNITIQNSSNLTFNLLTNQKDTLAIKSNELNLLTESTISINLNDYGIGIQSNYFNSYNSNLKITNFSTAINSNTTLIKNSNFQLISNATNSTGIESSSKVKIITTNMTIDVNNICIKSQESLSITGLSTINLSSKNYYSIDASSNFNLEEGSIIIKDYALNSKYENIIFYSENNTSTQLTLGYMDNNTIYSQNGEIKFEYIGATTSSNTINSITYKEKINEKIIVNLENDTFSNNLTSDWITNLPNGLTQNVTRLNDNSASILISGTPTSTSSEKINIKIPKNNLIKSTSALTVNSNAFYNIYSEDFFVRLIINNDNTFITINNTVNLKNNDIYSSHFNDKLYLSPSLEKGYEIKEIYYLNESLEKISIDIHSLSFFMPCQNIILNIALEKTSYKIEANDNIILNKYTAKYGDLIIIDNIIPKKGYYLTNIYYITTTTNTKKEISLSFPNFTMPNEDIIICAEFSRTSYNITIPNNVKIYRDSKELLNKDKIYTGDLLLITYDPIEHYSIDVTINGKKVLNNEIYEVTDSNLVITYYKKKTEFLVFYENNDTYTINIKSNNKIIENGDYIKENDLININVSSSLKYEITEILINGIAYTNNNINILMPNKDLIIYVKVSNQEAYLSDNNKIVIIDGNKTYLSTKKLTVTLIEKSSDSYTNISNQIRRYKLLDIIQVQIEDISTNQSLLSSSLTKTYLKIPKNYNLNNIILYSIKRNQIEKEDFNIVNIDNEKYALVYTNELNDYALVDTTLTPSTKNNLLSLLKPLTYISLIISPIILLSYFLKKKYKRAN